MIVLVPGLEKSVGNRCCYLIALYFSGSAFYFAGSVLHFEGLPFYLVRCFTLLFCPTLKVRRRAWRFALFSRCLGLRGLGSCRVHPPTSGPVDHDVPHA
jgi:hypothetical protein